jgi:hypothetical protein
LLCLEEVSVEEVVPQTEDAPAKRAGISAGFNKVRRRVFLEVLAATCNVAEACRSAGVGRHHVKPMRESDGEFARLFDAAMTQGREWLKEDVLAHALGPIGKGESAFQPSVAFKVLSVRDGGDGRGGRTLARAATQEQVDAALLKRLDALARRAVDQ